jgi:hypothetical protein
LRKQPAGSPMMNVLPPPGMLPPGDPTALPQVPAAGVRITRIVQDWPKLWANFKTLIWIFSQSVGPSLAIWANPVRFSFMCLPSSPSALLGH